ncbi:MAG TPA: peptidase, partial [Candidatus Nitrosotalea sp.]|nr:peptidase [Candidatus Nitrosotalea sp.]
MRQVIFLIIISSILFPSVILLSAYGDGLASEILPPEMIGNKNVTLSINSSPFLIDNTHVGTQINFILQDVATQEPFQDVTLAVSAFKNNQALFGHVFMSDSGNFLFNVSPDNSTDKISINEEGGPFPGLLGHGGSYQIKGPIFAAGGLYKFKINVLTMGSYDNQISKSYDAAISIPQTNNYTVNDNEDGKQTVTVVAYYDQIKNFQYNPGNRTMTFSMPFNWSQDNLKQVSVVHQELKIPRSFTNFVTTKYDAYVNGIKLDDKAVSIDDYSSDQYRIVHLILYKQEAD